MTIIQICAGVWKEALVAAAAGISALAVSGGASGQSSPPKSNQEPTAIFRAHIDVVEVDVAVTNAQGRFVRDLRREAFQLRESGQVQEIAALQMIDLPRAVPGTRQLPDALPSATGGSGGASPSDQGGRVYFLVLDDLHTRPENSSRVRTLAKEFIRRCVTRTDRAALAFTSGRSDAARQLLPPDDTFSAAIDRFVGQKVGSPTVEKFGGQREPAGATGRPSATDTRSPADAVRVHQARSSIDTLSRVVMQAAAIHGRRKSIVLLSEGIDVNLDGTDDTLREVRDQIRNLSATANRVGATLYALDPRGPSQGGEHAVEITGSGSQTMLTDELRVAQAGLQTLAEGTGGIAFLNTMDLDRVFSTIDEANSSYYLLSYSSSTPADGKFHPLDVRVALPGVTVKARRGFVKVPVAAPTAAPDTSARGTAPAPQTGVISAPVAPVTQPAAKEPTVAAAAESGARPNVTPTDVAAVLERVRQYLDEYVGQLSLVIGVERYTQWVTTSGLGAAFSQGGDRPTVRNTVSEFALVRVKDDWVGYRDVVEVDGKPVRDRQDRLQQLFLHNSDAARSQARKIADESARYNAGAMQRNFNVPTMALYFLQPVNASRFRFTSEGSDTVDGVVTSKIHYQESRRPTVVRTPNGVDMPVSGTLWIDPTSGRVLRTFLAITSEVRLSQSEDAQYDSRGARVKPRNYDPGKEDRTVPTFARITVTYRHDDRLGMLVPGEMTEEYQSVSVASSQERIQRTRCRALYSDFRKFETSGTVIIRAPE